MQNVEQTEVYTVVKDIEDKKIALVANENEEKGKLCMDPIIEILWQSKEYSAPMDEAISWVRKSM